MHPDGKKKETSATRVAEVEYEVLKRHARIQEALSRPELGMDEFKEIVETHREALIRLKKLRDRADE